MFDNALRPMLVAAAGILAVGSTTGEVRADTLEVSASLPSICEISTGAITLGDLVGAGPFTGQADIVLSNCQTGTANFDVRVSAGENVSSANKRQMKNEFVDEFVEYTVDELTTSTADIAPNATFPTLNGTSLLQFQVNVLGADIVDKAPGAYSDTIDILVDFTV